jgi:hypothetical protein
MKQKTKTKPTKERTTDRVVLPGLDAGGAAARDVRDLRLAEHLRTRRRTACDERIGWWREDGEEGRDRVIGCFR